MAALISSPHHFLSAVFRIPSRNLCVLSSGCARSRGDCATWHSQLYNGCSLAYLASWGNYDPSRLTSRRYRDLANRRCRKQPKKTLEYLKSTMIDAFYDYKPIARTLHVSDISAECSTGAPTIKQVYKCIHRKVAILQVSSFKKFASF